MNLIELHKDHKKAIVELHDGPHYGKEICITCGGAFVTWVSRATIDVHRRYNDMLDDRDRWTIDIKVPYDDIKIVKAQGARWDAKRKTWFIDVRILQKPNSKKYKILEPYIDLDLVVKWADQYLDQWDPNYDYKNNCKRT